MKRENIILGLIIIGIAIVMRVLPHAANFSPVSALALFGGAYLPRRMAFVLPIVVMLASDVFLGFHQSMPYVYGSLVLTTAIGFWLRERKSFATVIGASILSSVLFFLITNFGFFLTYSLYPKTLSGQMSAYINALPFFRNTLISDLFYTGLFFGGYVAIMKFVKGERHANLHKNGG